MSKGFAAWMLTKMAFILYAALIFSALFSFYYLGNNFFQQQQVISQTEEVANLIDAANSSPYDSNISIQLKQIDLLVTGFTGSYNYVMLKKGDYNYSRVIQSNASETEIQNPSKISIIKRGSSLQVVKWE